MASVLVRSVFRHADFSLAKNTSVRITGRGSDTTLRTVVTDETGSVAFYIAEGLYDFRVYGAVIPFEAREIPDETGEPGGEGPSDFLLAHIADETPHPVYDEGPSFLLLYQNAKV